MDYSVVRLRVENSDFIFRTFARSHVLTVIKKADKR